MSFHLYYWGYVGTITDKSLRSVVKMYTNGLVHELYRVYQCPLLFIFTNLTTQRHKPFLV